MLKLKTFFLSLFFDNSTAPELRKGKEKVYSRLSLNGHLYKTDTSVKRTPRAAPRLS